MARSTPANRRRSLIGAHVSVGKGLVKGGLARAEELGAELVQVFVGNPRGWADPKVDPVADELFRVTAADRGIAVFVHAPYLINFGSPSPQTLHKSSAALEFSLRRAMAIGARGVVLHAGSAVLGNRWEDAMAQVQAAVPPLVEQTLGSQGGTQLLIEPTAGGGGALASDLPSLAAYLDLLGRDERIGVCLDTCHLHAAGHDLSSEKQMSSVLRSAHKVAGVGGVGLIHVNDSRDPVGSKRDRHAALGAGSIGLDAFSALFSTPPNRGVPLVVETAECDHAADIALLKKLRSAATGAR
ncbi:endonuclease IV [Jatrophihabitans sp. GAS493]|uniref:deoxyribonuclease IV n=1 Tax=Jatrophihabitans sp. GAS493 TaxID=1907575 RepID=UPI000BB84121|nr:deoxyribonuclease IV [Jatrophihabitans sp. GAS493]SOD74359.1 endonuclease IV [Jatrophihabitans sp. GAS493]